MPVPDFQTLMLPVLTLTSQGRATIPDMLPDLARRFTLSEEEQAELLPSGKQSVLSNRAHWARNYMYQAGLVDQIKRGHYRVSDAGRALLDENPSSIDRQTLSRFPAFNRWLGKTSEKPKGGSDTAVPLPDPFEVETPESTIEKAARQIEAALARELLDAVLALSPERFERLILDLLRAMGYGGGADGMYRETPRSADGGFDGIIDEDALGLDAVYIQAKRYAPDSKVGREALQAFVGSLTGEGASKGVFVTTSDFSKHARDYMARVQQRIVLINGDRLARLMIAHDVGVRARQTYVIRSVDEDYFADTA